MRKKIDSRIRTLIENNVKQNHRSFFVVIGDKGRDQIVNLHYMLSKSIIKSRPSVLWCYKKELGFSSHKKKRMRQLKKKIAKGTHETNEDDPFELLVSSTNIRYCYYKETHKILGNTFGMLILQDFEAITPNLLARTIETVEGGGVIVLLLKTMNSLKKLYAMSMDVHSRFRTDSHTKVQGRFNERFILSLSSCESCLVVDDELNILPISSHARYITPVGVEDEDSNEILSDSQRELKELKLSMAENQPMGNLCSLTKTLDQAKALLVFMEAISEKNLRSTVALTAGRGRGKSAALGLAVAAAIAIGYSNIFVTSPSPENLRTFFDFVFKGFDAIDYKEHLDYELVESTAPELNRAIVRVNVFRTHRQTIQYIQPQDSEKLGQAELVVIDEAAAIPLPLVKKLLGPYLVFMASTINGYEGTGRSLSLKLIEQLREQSRANSQKTADKSGKQQSSGGRILREISLEEPIRYSPNDQVEKWLNQLLCLDCSKSNTSMSKGCPHPSKCELYYVSKDTLFSFHSAAEEFLHRVMSLYVSSHYKNTPNDLLLISDAPAHHLFVLLGPTEDAAEGSLPDVLCVIQVAFEGKISRDIVIESLGKGEKQSGDMIPWSIAQQYQDSDFASLSGARIVRIATHPDFQRMGYGKRALDQLTAYFEGKISNLSEFDENNNEKMNENEENNHEKGKEENLLTELVVPRTNLPPLLVKLSERAPEDLHYLGTSFGITQGLFTFWKKAGYFPLYIRQTSNDITGEHSSILLKALHVDDVAPDWVEKYSIDFRKRFIQLLSFNFRNFSPVLGLDILLIDHATTRGINNNNNNNNNNNKNLIEKKDIDYYFTQYDLKRMESYAQNLVDYHVIMDLMPSIATLYFTDRFPFGLSAVQAAVLLAVGLQRKSLEDIVRFFFLILLIIDIYFILILAYYFLYFHYYYY